MPKKCFAATRHTALLPAAGALPSENPAKHFTSSWSRRREKLKPIGRFVIGKSALRLESRDLPSDESRRGLRDAGAFIGMYLGGKDLADGHLSFVVPGPLGDLASKSKVSLAVAFWQSFSKGSHRPGFLFQPREERICLARIQPNLQLLGTQGRQSLDDDSLTSVNGLKRCTGGGIVEPAPLTLFQRMSFSACMGARSTSEKSIFMLCAAP